MKDKLRELAAKYRRHATSCGSPVYENCADDIQNILEAWGEAEGDAEEVAESLSDDAELVRRQLGPDNEVSENMERAAEILRTYTYHILDAEGDGGAVGVWTDQNIDPTAYSYAAGVMGTCPEGPTDGALKRAIASYLNHSKSQTHPARSGVVSDDVWPQVDRMLVDAWLLGTESEKLDMLKMRDRYASLKSSLQSPQTVRSVSHEDVEECWMVLTGRAGSIAHEKDHECMMDIERKAVRAALEHFAAIAQEKQS